MRNFRKLRSRRSSRLVESHRARRRMIRESVKNTYGIPHLFWEEYEEDEKEAINKVCDNMTVANFMKFPCKTTKAAKTTKNKTYIYDKTLWNDIGNFVDSLAEKYFVDGMSMGIAELIVNSRAYDKLEDEFFAKYPKVDIANESRRSRNSSITEAQAIRKIARIISEAEEDQGDLFGKGPTKEEADEIKKMVDWVCSDSEAAGQTVYENNHEGRPVSKISDSELKDIIIDEGVLAVWGDDKEVDVPREYVVPYITKSKIAEFRKSVKKFYMVDQDELEDEWKAEHGK